MVEIFNAVPNVLDNRKRIILSLICMTSILYCPGSSGNCTRKWNNFTIVLIVFLLVVFALVWNKNIRTKPLTGLQLPPRDCCVIWFLFTNTWTAKLFCLNTSGIDHFQGSEISSSRKLRPRILRSWKLMIVTNPKCQIAQSRVDNWRPTRDLIYFYSKQGRRHFSRNVEWTSILWKLRMRKQKNQNNSTSGHGARASYQTMLPEISARRSLFWVKVQIPVVTDRHWGRDKSAPRP